MIDKNKKLWKWGPVDGQVIYLLHFMEQMVDCKTQNEISWSDAITHFRNGKTLFVSEYDALYNKGRLMFEKYLLNDERRNKYFEIWNKIKDELVELIYTISNESLNKLTNKEFYNLSEKFHKAYDEFWKYGLIPEIANFGGEDIFKTLVNKKNAENFIEIFEALATPEDLSFYQIEELDLLKIKLQNGDLDSHQRKYFWINNSYGRTKIKTLKEFEEEFSELNKEEIKERINLIQNYSAKVKQKKEEIIKKYSIDEEIQNVALKLSFSVWWQDYRKQYIFMALHVITLFAKDLSVRYNISFEDLKLYTRNDFLSLTKKGIKVENINLRREGFISYYREKENDIVHYLGKKANNLISEYVTLDLSNDVSEIKGVVVSKGKVTGRVKLLSGARHFDSFKEGDILVTSMTSPEFIIPMRKASAIITDEGGITSHAAIVSRELGIPCIVGTKIATRVLSDGDLIEVDAEKGIVRKIN